MDSLAQVTLVWHCHSEFSDSGEPSVLKQSVYVCAPRSTHNIHVTCHTLILHYPFFILILTWPHILFPNNTILKGLFSWFSRPFSRVSKEPVTTGQPQPIEDFLPLIKTFVSKIGNGLFPGHSCLSHHWQLLTLGKESNSPAFCTTKWYLIRPFSPSLTCWISFW